MVQRPLSPSLMMELTGKQMLRVCVCLCIGSKTEKKRGRDGKKERESAGRCLHSLCGRLKAVCRGQRDKRVKERKKERKMERDRDGRIK